jgi:NMD protein affecting ribosome stability and mRNA decay
MDRAETRKNESVNAGAWRHRRDAIVPETGHDAYRVGQRFAEPTVCPDCEAVFHEGRWTWADAPPRDAALARCPACLRARDGYAAGILALTGPFLSEHRKEILNLLENVSVAETAEHPLHRKLDSIEAPEGVVVTTTDVHLCRRMGEALKHAYGGTFEFRYLEDDTVVRASWHR